MAEVTVLHLLEDFFIMMSHPWDWMIIALILIAKCRTHSNAQLHYVGAMK